ncbi:MAG: CocE/NonD family hydrolase, partial [Acidobacteriota bacterium]
MTWRVLALIVLSICQVVEATGQPPAAGGAARVRERYTKYEYRIPMRDGARLFTAVYVPKDKSRPYPFLLTRTPYSIAPYGVESYPESLGPAPL